MFLSYEGKTTFLPPASGRCGPGRRPAGRMRDAGVARSPNRTISGRPPITGRRSFHANVFGGPEKTDPQDQGIGSLRCAGNGKLHFAVPDPRRLDRAAAQVEKDLLEQRATLLVAQ